MDWTVSLPTKTHVETFTSKWTLGNRAFRSVIKINWKHKGGAPIQKGWHPYKESGETEEIFLSLCAERRHGVGHRKKVALYKPGWEGSLETNPDWSTLILIIPGFLRSSQFWSIHPVMSMF